MTGNSNWNYDTTFTVRVDKATKDRLWQAAQAKGILFSQYIRAILEQYDPPEDQHDLPAQSARELIERQIMASNSRF